MTIQEKLESIKDKNIGIICYTREQSNELVEQLNITTNENCDGFFHSQPMVYSLEDYNRVGGWTYGNIQCYEKDNAELIPYLDFISDTTSLQLPKYELSFSNVKKLLDEKYGEDNWVIK